MVWIRGKDVYFVRRHRETVTCLLAKMTAILLYIHLRATTGHYGLLRRPGSSCFCE